MATQMIEYLTVGEVAAILKVEKDAVRSYVHRGVLPAARLPGGHIRVRRIDVEALLEPSMEGKAEIGAETPTG